MAHSQKCQPDITYRPDISKCDSALCPWVLATCLDPTAVGLFSLENILVARASFRINTGRLSVFAGNTASE